MAGKNTRRSLPGTKELDQVQLQRYVKRFSDSAVKNAREKETLGKWFCDKEFGDDGEAARNFTRNPYYLQLRHRAKHGELPMTPRWLYEVIHVAVLDRILDSLGKAEDFRALSFSHRALFLPIGSNRLYEFIESTAKLALSNGWTVKALRTFLATDKVTKQYRTVSATRLSTSLKRQLDALNTIRKLRTVSKLTHRKVASSFYTLEELSKFEKALDAEIKELSRYQQHARKEKAVREKARQRKVG